MMIYHLSRRPLVISSILLLAAALNPLTAADVRVTDIGTINGRNSSGQAINAAGDVAGVSSFYFAPPNGPVILHAVLYSDGMLRDLGALNGYATCSPLLGCESWALGINSSKWIVGSNSGDAALLAFAWLPVAVPGATAGFNVLPMLSTTPGTTEATAINDAGVIVGDTTPDGVGPRPVRWQLGPSGFSIDDLGTLRVDSGGYGIATGINGKGQIVGSATVDGYNFQQAFLYLPKPAYGFSAGMHNLMAGRTVEGTAQGINQRGQVVGTASGGAWIWLPTPAYGLPAGLSMLPLTNRRGGQPSRKITKFSPTGISDVGQVVGQAKVFMSCPPWVGGGNFSFPVGPCDVTEPAVWRNGQWTMLNDLLPPESPWSLVQALAIAHKGQTTRITGPGLLAGVTDTDGNTPAAHGYVLTVFCGGDLDGDGAVDQKELRELSRQHGQRVPPGTGGDLTGDGPVDGRDFRVLAAQSDTPCL